MHTADSSQTPSAPSQPAAPAPPGGPSDTPPRHRPGKWLWIALSLVVLVAAAAAIVCFWYLPSRDAEESTVASAGTTDSQVGGEKDGDAVLTADQIADASAVNLLRTAMSAIESAYVNSDTRTYDPAVVTPEMLSAIAPTVTFNPWTSPAAASEATAETALSAVDYAGDELNFAIGTVSETGRVFGAVVTREGSGATWYYVDGREADWSTYAATPSPTGEAGAEAVSTPGLYEDPLLGCSFEYPTDWVVYEYQQIHGALTDDPSVFIVGDPSTTTTPIPVDFLEFSGVRTPGEPAPSPREAAEYFAADYAETQRAGGQQPDGSLDDRFFVEERVNGISACYISYLTMDGMDQGDAPQYWTVYFLSYEDTSFLFQFVTTATNAEVNDAVFHAVLESFRIDRPNE